MQNVIEKVLWYLLIEDYGDFCQEKEESCFFFRFNSIAAQFDYAEMSVDLSKMEFTLRYFRDESYEEYGKMPGDLEGDWYLVENPVLDYKVVSSGFTEIQLARMLYVYLRRMAIKLPEKLRDPLRDLALGFYRW